MVKGRPGLYLEACKFGIYLSIPVFASVYYSDPDIQRYWADYWQFIKYPENPNVNVKEKIQILVTEKEQQREQLELYKQQLRDLQIAAERGNNFDADESRSGVSWWGRAGRWVTGSSKKESEN
jgi:hypothetical protein